MSNTKSDMETVLKILKTSRTTDTLLMALEFILGLTGTNEGLEVIYKSGNDVPNILLRLLLDPEVRKLVREKAASILINLSAEDKGAHLLSSATISDDLLQQTVICKMSMRETALSALFFLAIYSDKMYATQAYQVLSNISRNADVARRIFDVFQNPKEAIGILVDLLPKKNTDIQYDHVASLLNNLSQLTEVRRILLDTESEFMQKVLPLIDYKDSVTRRLCVLGTIRNLSLYPENHEVLLKSDVDLLPRLVLPLAGPEEFDDEDTEKLPLDLQYLPENKEREPEPELRKMLLELIMQLCATKDSREIMRKYNIYVILREYHKWETNEECLLVCEDLVNILIRTEDEIGVDNFHNLEIPNDVLKKFEAS